MKKRKEDPSRLKITTTAELARHVGLSRATVSRILNGHSGIKPENTERVRRVIEHTGFTRNPYSNILRGQRSATIAVCLSDFTQHALVKKLAKVVQRLAQAGYTALIETAESTDHVRIIRWAMRMRAEAVMFVGQHHGTGLAAHVQELAEEGIPHVFTDSFDGASANVVTVDRVRALELIGAHLLDLGHRKFGIMGISSGRTAIETARIQGLQRAIEARRLDPAQVLVSLPDPPPRNRDLLFGREIARQFAARPGRPTAYVALNDSIAFGAIEGFRTVGVRVPDDVSVTGFNNEDISVLAAPSITTIEPEVENGVSAAVDFLVGQLRKEIVTLGHAHLLPPRLILRQSTGPARR